MSCRAQRRIGQRRVTNSTQGGLHCQCTTRAASPWRPAQDWTKLENEDAQGLVEITYRTGDEPGRPPDVQAIQKQMAIVAWQPGPNRTLKVPSEVSTASAQRPLPLIKASGTRRLSGMLKLLWLQGLRGVPGVGGHRARSTPAHAHTHACPHIMLQAEIRELEAGQVIERIPARPGQRIPYTNTIKRPQPAAKPDPFEGTWEVLTLDANGKPFLDRHDVWGWTPPGHKGGLQPGGPTNSKGPSGGQPPPTNGPSTSGLSNLLRGFYLGK